MVLLLTWPEYPAVAKNASRLILQVMADHTIEHIDRFVRVFDQASKKVDHIIDVDSLPIL